MCIEEMDSIKKIGISNKEGCYEDKLFATNIEDAVNFGKANFLLDRKSNFILKFVVSDNILYILDGPFELDFKKTYIVHKKNFDLFNEHSIFEEILYCPLVLKK